MHTLTKTLLSVAAAGILSFGAFAAEGPRHHGHGHGGGLQRMQQTLNLSDEQLNQLKPVFEAQRAQQKQMREQMKAQFDSILTADQKAQLEAFRAERKEGKREGNRDGKFRHGKGGPFAKLNLSDDQKAQMKALRESMKPQMQAQRQRFEQQLAQVLTPEQKAKLDSMKAEWKQHRHHRGGGERRSEG